MLIWRHEDRRMGRFAIQPQQRIHNCKDVPKPTNREGLEDTKYRKVTPLVLAPTFVTFSMEGK